MDGKADPPETSKRLRQTSIVESFKKVRSLEHSGLMEVFSDDDVQVNAVQICDPAQEQNTLEIQAKNDKKGNIIYSGCEDDGSCSSYNTAQNQKVPKNIKNNEEPSSLMDDNLSQSLFSDSDTNFSPEEQPVALGISFSYLKRRPECCPALPLLKTDDPSHTVLFRPYFRPSEAPRPFPDNYSDKWDNDHVRLPCSPENLYPIDDERGQKKLERRWCIIKNALQTKMVSSLGLEAAIMTYNARYNNKWNFTGLHYFLTKVLDSNERQDFFSHLLPAMVNLALDLPKICTHPIPLLRRQNTHTLTLSQKQIASLLANAFFCTFPRRNAQRRNSEYSTFPDINFNQLFVGTKNGINPRMAEKLKCLLNYFKRVTDKEPDGCVTFHRQHLNKFPEWENVQTELRNLHITSEGTIEDDGIGMLQVDFANKFLGGGVLRRGCVQEEIRFVICPELIVSRLFTEMLDPSECVIITGCEQFNKYEGYADNFKWAGNFIDVTKRDTWNRRCTEIAAIDAINFRVSKEQYFPHWLKREINKAFCGFCSPGQKTEHLAAVATGNWGCGVYRGDPHLKSMLQLMAAAVAGRDLLYFTFQNPQLCQQIHSMFSFLKENKVTVGNLWNIILKYHGSFIGGRKSRTGIYDFIYSILKPGHGDNDFENERKEKQKKLEERKQRAESVQQDFMDDDEGDALLKLYEIPCVDA